MIKLRTLISEVKKKEKISSRLERCYELSGRYMYSYADSILVHGHLINPFGKGLKEINHAWIEDGNEVFDPVMDMSWPKEVYESLFKAKVDKKYSSDEMLKKINETGHWGPWA